MIRPGPGLGGALVALALLGCGEPAGEPRPAGPAATARPAPRPTLLAVGAKVPAIRATAHDGQVVDLAALGRPTVIYFYPKDETPG